MVMDFRAKKNNHEAVIIKEKEVERVEIENFRIVLYNKQVEK